MKFESIIKRLEVLQNFAGIILLTIGVGLLSIPAALITAGSLLLIDIYLSKLRVKK